MNGTRNLLQFAANLSAGELLLQLAGDRGGGIVRIVLLEIGEQAAGEGTIARIARERHQPDELGGTRRTEIRIP